MKTRTLFILIFLSFYTISCQTKLNKQNDLSPEIKKILAEASRVIRTGEAEGALIFQSDTIAYNKALTILENGYKQHSSCKVLLKQLIVLHTRMDNDSIALSYINVYLECDSTDMYGLTTKAVLLDRMNDSIAAAKYYKKALDLNEAPHDFSSNVQKVLLLNLLNKKKEANILIDSLLIAYPDESVYLRENYSEFQKERFLNKYGN